MKRLRLNGRKVRYAIAFMLGIGVAGVGDYASFRNLMKYAAQHDFGVPWGLPVGLDAGIPALLLLDSLRPSRFLRVSAWTLSAGTVFANAAVTPDHSWVARGLHGVMPALAILWYEAIRRINRTEDTHRMDQIRWSRYLVSPVRTARLRMRMIRWEITSYADALRMESAILLARTVLVSAYRERTWRRTRRSVPVILAHQLDTGQLPQDLFFGTDWSTAVRTWITGALDDLDPNHPAALTRNAMPDPDPVADRPAIERDPWECIWEHRDRLIPEEVSPAVFAKAFGLARWHFEQFNRHIVIKDMRNELGVRNAHASTLARLLQSAYENGPERAIPSADPQSPGTSGDGATAGTALNGDGACVPAAALVAAGGEPSRNGQGTP